MNKVNVIIGLLLSIAGTFASAEEVIFKGLAGQDWPKLEAALVESNLLKDGRFPTSALAETAYGNVQSNKLPGSELTKGAYITLFKMHNALGESISVEEFKKRGQASGFTLPGTLNRDVVPPVVAAAPVAAPVAAPAAPTAVSPDTVLSRKYDILNGQVQALKSQLAKGGDEKQMAHLAGLMAAVQSDIKALKGNEANFAQKAELDKLAAGLGGLTGRMDTVEKTVSILPALVKTEAGKAADAAIAAQLAPLQADVATMKAESGGWQAWVYGLTAAITALVVLFFFAIGRSGSSEKAAKAASVEAGKAVTAAQSAKTEAEATKVDVAKVTKSVAAISEEIKGLNEVTGRRTVIFPDNFDKELAMLQISDTYTFEVGVAGIDQSFKLRVGAVREGYVTVFGIKDQVKEVAVKNLRATIGKSAKILEDGTSRLVGVDDSLRSVEKGGMLDSGEDFFPPELQAA
jgi:hypothetical protein